MAGPNANSGYRILRVPSTGSTNADALALARRGEPGGLVVVADHQSAGRGRLDRRWEAPAGTNLLASIVFRPSTPVTEWFRFTMAVGLAVLDACRALEVQAALKWPNDVIVGNDKLAGILAETDGQTALVVGFGVNVGWPANGELEGATSLAAHGVNTTPSAVLAAVLASIDAGADDLLDRYRRHCATLGRAVRVDLPGGGSVDGQAHAVDDDGQLVIEVARRDHTSDSVPEYRRFSVGDIAHLRDR